MKGWGLIFVLLASSCLAQENLNDPDSLKIKLLKTPNDTNRVLLLCDLSYSYRFVNVDSAQVFAARALQLSQRLGFKKGQAWAYLLDGTVASIRGHMPMAISSFEKSLHLADSLRNFVIASRALTNIGWCAFDLEDYYRALNYFQRSLNYERKSNPTGSHMITLQMNIGQCYLVTKKLKEAEEYLDSALAKGRAANPNFAYLVNLFSALRLEQKKYVLADSLLTAGWSLIKELPDKIDKADNRYYFSKLKLALGDMQVAFNFAMEALGYYSLLGSNVDLKRTYQLLSDIEARRGNIKQSLNYLLASNAQRDSVFNSAARYSEFLFDQHEQEKQMLSHQRDRELLRAQQRYQQIIWFSSLFIFMGIAGGLGLFLRQKQRTNLKLLKLNEALVKKEKDIVQRNSQLQEINLSKDKLFSVIGHDLRSPLMSLKGFLNLLSLQSENLTEKELKLFLSDLDRSLKNLSDLLENLLEWSHAQTGTTDFHPQLFDIGQSIAENIELFKDQASAKNISIINESHEKVIVNAHRHSIHSVIRNLISNAIKFTPASGTVTLRTELGADAIRVSVNDTGRGIDKEAMQRLFKIGVKHSTLGTAKEKGSGLGLVLCKDFVEKNKGKIGLESTDGKGTTFYFTLPKGPQG